MQDGMTIGANRAQIPNRIQLVFFSDFPKRLQVVYMNETFSEDAIEPREVDATDHACLAPMGYTLASRIRISFIDVDRNCLLGTFNNRFRISNLLRKNIRVSQSICSE